MLMLMLMLLLLLLLHISRVVKRLRPGRMVQKRGRMYQNSNNDNYSLFVVPRDSQAWSRSLVQGKFCNCTLGSVELWDWFSHGSQTHSYSSLARYGVF